MLRTSSRNLMPEASRGVNTFIELCNMVCRRLNEVEIAPEDFQNTRGIQSLVKDAVKAAVAKINQAEFEWPFNAAEHTELLVPGQNEYTWPDAFKVADYNSFQIVQDSTLGVGFKTLKLIERDAWYKHGRDKDYDAGAAGRGIPDFVFAGHGSSFGVTQSPDKAYTLRYRYYLNYSDLKNYDDVSRIPSSFNTVLINGALYHMYMFRDNAEAAATTNEAFKAGLKDLQILLLNNYEYLRDTRVNF